jgi:bifunctional DNase/RNase
MREIECELSKIIINEGQEGQVVWLQEKDGKRAFAIVVGFFEASSLRDRVREFVPPRPMTHHLVSNCIRDLGGKLERVLISELKENTYYARLIVRQDGRVVEVDARPSDALVLAVQEKVPVFVADDVLSEASKWSIAPEISFPQEDLDETEDEDEEGSEEEPGSEP